MIKTKTILMLGVPVVGIAAYIKLIALQELSLYINPRFFILSYCFFGFLVLWLGIAVFSVVRKQPLRFRLSYLLILMMFLGLMVFEPKPLSLKSMEQKFNADLFAPDDKMNVDEYTQDNGGESE